MTIKVTTLSDVTVDGGPSNNIVQAAATAATQEARDAILAAALAYEAAQAKSGADALKAATDKATEDAASIAALTAERDAHAQTIADFLACDDAGKAKMLADAAKSAEQKERDAARDEFDAAQSAADAAKAKLDALQ